MNEDAIASALHELNVKVEAIHQSLKSLHRKTDIMNASVNALTLAVANETTVEASVVTLLTNLAAQLQNGIDAGDLAAIQAATTQLTTNAATLSAAVVANTPTPPAPVSGS